MLVDGTRKNTASNKNNYKLVPTLNNRSSKSTSFTFSNPKVSVFTFCIVFSLGSFAFSDAQPYKTNVNNINWARFVAPSPLEMAPEPFNDYEDDERSDEDGIIENEPIKGSKKDVSIFSWCHSGYVL